jgi:hypothetical protein
MDVQLIEKARELINRNLASTTLSTVDQAYNVNIAVISILEMVNEDTILCARFGADRTYANLKQTGKGVFMVLVLGEAQTKEGIRVYVELVSDETEGANFERMRARLDNTKYRDFPLKNCLVFRITGIAPISTLGKLK